MKTACLKPLSVLLLAFAATWASAQEGMVQLDIGRGQARLPVYAMPHPKATATLILLPGGDAGTGKISEGKPSNGNFLSRTRADFHAADFNVIVVYRASDLNALDYSYRVSKEHVEELSKVIAYAQQQFGKPVWLVGTSRGTVSGTAAAIALGEANVQGLVLTSSVTSKKQGAIATQNIASLKIPVLVLHHKNDACKICVPYEASRITADLKSAPVKKFIMVEGGSDPEGDPCEAKHWHGFINHEKETVKLITDWVKNPQS
ncbi:MAG: hypothetical protein RL559_1019 [Pseudomonadota bacterium]|jgi:hypothetical protein